MKPPKVTPVDSAREFQVNELFFSTTDRTGVILSGNHVFKRVSGYTEDQLIGQPHNLIRHPDMPRAVFRLVWDVLRQGRAVAGYVKNLAADGRYYWVVAVITPVTGGYLSVRFKPTDPLHAAVIPLLAEMRRLELEAEERGEPGAAGMDRAHARLTEFLRAAGFADYDAFMAVMVRQELRSRDNQIAAGSLELFPLRLGAAQGRDQARLESIHLTCLEAYRELCRLYDGLDHYLELDRELRTGFAAVSDLSDGIRLVALNAKIKAAQLGAHGFCLGVVADFLGQASSELSGVCHGLIRQMAPVAAGLQTAMFNLAAARLQLEMILRFTADLAQLDRVEHAHARDLDQLQAAFDGTIGPAVEALHQMEQSLLGFRGHSEEFAKLALNLQVAQTTGAIEASRLEHDAGLVQTFADLRRQNEGCREETNRLDGIISRFDALAASSPAIIRQIQSSIQATRRSVQELVSLLERDPTAESAPEPAPPVDAEEVLAVVS